MKLLMTIALCLMCMGVGFWFGRNQRPKPLQGMHYIGPLYLHGEPGFSESHWWIYDACFDWFDGEPSVNWPKRADGGCYAEDAPAWFRNRKAAR